MALLISNRFVRSVIFSYKRYKTLIWSIVLLFLTVNIVLYNYTQSQPLFEIDEIYEGTFRGKYLQSITDINQLNSDEFYEKWQIIGFLDDLIDEPINHHDLDNSIDPFFLLSELEKKDNDFNFLQKTLLDKIKIYNNAILLNSNFTFHPIQNVIYKDAYYGKKFINTRLKKWIKIKAALTSDELKMLDINDDWFQDTITELRNKKLQHNLVYANEIKYTLSHFKIFSHLFLKSDITKEENLNDYLYYCSSISSKLFNWLSGELPIFKKFDKKMNPSIVYPFNSINKDLFSHCFIKSLQSSFNGKGIVITSSNGLVPELAGLLSILKVTGNKLPIQIFHNNDLSLESIKILNDIALDPIMKTPNAIKLDLTFVDISKTLVYPYSKYYGHFGMKLLAYLFNSFEEMVMLDTDTVILESIDYYFNIDGYIKNGAYFFRDREANSFLYQDIVEYYKSYLNHENEIHYLGLPRVKDEVLNNRFFGEYARHFMESGLFIINKKEKFDGVVTSVILQMLQLFSSLLHGEKEFIWLGQEIMGQSYGFNSNPAIAIGELSPENGLKSHELCSTHPAHIDENDKLLWFNSGFLTCKKPQSYYKDINYKRNKDKTLVELKKEYLSPLHITHGLRPPPAEYLVETEDGETMRGWMMTQQCSNYLWCSYDLSGLGSEFNVPVGDIIRFDSASIEKYDKLGKLWVRYFNIGSLGSSDSGFIEGDNYDELGLDKLDVFKNKFESEPDEDIDVFEVEEKKPGLEEKFSNKEDKFFLDDTKEEEEEENRKDETNVESDDGKEENGKNRKSGKTGNEDNYMEIIDKKHGISKVFKDSGDDY